MTDMHLINLHQNRLAIYRDRLTVKCPRCRAAVGEQCFRLKVTAKRPDPYRKSVHLARLVAVTRL